jgi:hypothetical protein
VRPLKESQRELLANAANAYHDQLMASHWGAEYLKSRGFDRRDAERFLLGAVDDPYVPAHSKYKGMICIPNFCATGEQDAHVVGLKFRNLEDGQKYLGLPGQQARLFNLRAIQEASDTIVVTEGECFPDDAEVLTPKGWVRLDSWNNEKVAQWDNGDISFVKPAAYVRKNFDGSLVSYSQRGYTSVTTPGHRLPSVTRKGKLKFSAADDGGKDGTTIPRAGLLDGPGIPLLDDEIRLLLAIQADGMIDARSDGRPYIRFGIKKQRKVDRLHKLFASLGIDYSDNPAGSRGGVTSRGYRFIGFRCPDGFEPFKMLPWSWIADATLAQRRMILDELLEWDGNHVHGRTMTEFSNKHKVNAEWAQALAHTSGFCSSVFSRSNKYGSWFKATLLHDKSTSDWASVRKHREDIPYSGEVFCVTVPSGAILIRQNDHVTVSGNCDAITVDKVGLPCIGVPGTDMWGKDSYRNRLLEGFTRVILIRDNDEPGKHLAKAMASLDQLEIRVPPEGFKDVNEMWVETKDAEAIRRFILEDK